MRIYLYIHNQSFLEGCLEAIEEHIRKSSSASSSGSDKSKVKVTRCLTVRWLFEYHTYYTDFVITEKSFSCS